MTSFGGCKDSIGDDACFGVLTVSDRASQGIYEDLSGPEILKFFGDAVHSPWKAKYEIVPDEQNQIEEALKSMVL